MNISGNARERKPITLGPDRGHFGRSRDLRKFNKNFPDLPLETVIRQRIAENQSVRILEVGCGEGRVIMQLRKIFPHIGIVGINRGPWRAMLGTQSLAETALHYGIFSASELPSIALPEIVFCDAKRLEFADNHFDVIYSQVAVQYIAHKAQFLSETWRTLKPGGIALLNIDHKSIWAPKFMRADTPRFLIYKDKTVIPLSAIIEDARRKGFDITYYPRRGAINLIIRKNKADPLTFNLDYIPEYSFDLRALIPGSSASTTLFLWGFRSFYRVRG